MDEAGHLNNRWVCFKLRDVFIPPAQELMERLHADDVLRGRVLGLTSRGESSEPCVVVEIVGVDGAVVVPLLRVVSVI